MGAMRRWALKLRELDDRHSRGLLRRPGRTMRLLGLAVLLCLLYGLTEAKGWRQHLTGISEISLVSLIVIAPRGLYDGRFQRWSDRHKVLAWLPAAVFIGVVGFLVLSDIAEDWKFGLIVLLGCGCVAVLQLVMRRL